MYLKKKYRQTLVLFIVCYFIITIYFLFVPISSHFNRFNNSYLKTQANIFQKLFVKEKTELKKKLIQYCINDELYYQIENQDKDWLATKFDLTLNPSLDTLDSIMLINQKKEIIFLNTKRVPIKADFLQTPFIERALKDLDYQSGLIRKDNQFYLLAVGPVVQSRSRANSKGVLVFIQIFDKYFIEKNIIHYMDDENLTLDISTIPSPTKTTAHQTYFQLKSIENRALGSIILKQSNPYSTGVNELLLQNVLISTSLLILLFIFLNQFLSHKMAEKVELLNAEVEKAVQRNFNHEIKLLGDDAISDLANKFNQMSQTMRDYVKQILRTNERLNSTYLEIIYGLITAIEAKDSYAKGHAHRVMVYAEMIAKKIKYPDLEIIRMAALLHDIGKINVPEYILNKPDQLTSEEYHIVKNHSDYGSKILSNLKEFKRIKNIIHFHHERIDGKGYPIGMKDIIIPIESRIIAVADTFDAITHERAYRKKMTCQEAIAELQRVKGTQLDGKIVDIFIEIIQKNDYFANILLKNQNHSPNSQMNYNSIG